MALSFSHVLANAAQTLERCRDRNLVWCIYELENLLCLVKGVEEASSEERGCLEQIVLKNVCERIVTIEAILQLPSSSLLEINKQFTG